MVQRKIAWGHDGAGETKACVHIKPREGMNTGNKKQCTSVCTQQTVSVREQSKNVIELPERHPKEKFLVNFTSSCQRLLVINDQGASCLSLPTLKTFTEGIRIPLLSLAAANEDANGTLAARFMPFKEVNCQDELKISQPCPVGPPTFSGSAGTCSSVVTSIIYIFGYNQTGLTRAYVNATVEHNLTSTFKQKFTVLFLEDANFQLPSSVVLTQPDPTDYYSGAPGYRVRYPVRSGVYQGTGKIQMHPIPETNPDQAGGRQYGWWAVPAGGEFTALQTFSVPTATIRFGVDLTTVCLLRYTGNISGNGAVSQCQQLSDRITAVLNTNYTPPTHVASWGNLSVHSLKEWIPVTVIETNPGNITAGYRSCHKVVLGQTIRIVYTRNGSLDNPQNRILAVQRYLHRGSVQFQCGGRFCTPNNPDLQQTKPIVTVVKFVDATITPNDRIRESANQYGDIFYPFYVDDAASVMED
ncbi:unnamed protein product [Calicophoron daubneyi]|uniref:Tectonic-1-3 domain-containing protein n=1 Tax=Calicophoron daubneyi TaxID=300641 RepID=A0AAV2TN87_CALDB